MKTILLIFIVSFCTVVSQLILKRGVRDLTAIPVSSGGLDISIWLTAARAPLIWASLCLQAVGYCLWILILSKEKLGVAFGLSGAFFYLLLAFFGWIVLGERLNAYQWLGLTLITVGVLLTMPKL
jgi:drug/metabolite transporter (DMT)-like permease